MKPNDFIDHVVRKYPPWHQKTFFPRGTNVPKRKFQNAIASESFRRTFQISFKIIQAYGLDPKVRLGEKLFRK